MKTIELKTFGKTAIRLAIATSVASLFAIPQVSADSMAGGMATSQSGGVVETKSSSSATTQSQTQSGGPQSSASTTQSTTQNTTASQTNSSSDSGSLRDKTVKETGVQVKTTKTTTSPARKNYVSMRSTTVKSKKDHYVKRNPKWKTTRYDWKSGKKTVQTR